MKFTAKQYAQALIEAVETSSPADTEKILDNFVQVLAANNNLRLADEIIKEARKQDLANEGIKLANVTSATPINRENEEAIISALNQVAKSKIVLEKNLNPDLIGGVVVQVDDLLIDGSVKTNLNELMEKLSE